MWKLFLAGAIFTAEFCIADDWPQWRGAQRDGVWQEQGIAATFPAGGLRVLWRVPAGTGWSSPVIVGDKVFVCDAALSKPEAHERVTCYAAATGEKLWSHAWKVAYPDWAFNTGQESGPTATPIVHDGRVYAIGQVGAAVCLDARTGKPLWRRDFVADYEMKEFSANASPLLDNGLLICMVGGKDGAAVVALDAVTGAEKWRALEEGITQSSPIIVEAAGRRQLIVWTQQSITALDPATGSTFWAVPLLTSADNAVSTPVCDGSRLLVSSLMLKLHTDKPGAEVLWPESKGVKSRVLSNTSTPLLKDGHIYSVRSSGGLVCLDAASGAEVWKNDRATTPKQGSALHITLQGDSCLLFNDQGELIRARLTPQGYQELARSPLITPQQLFAGHRLAWSPPSYADGRVFVRNQQELVCASLSAAGAKP